MKVEYIDHMGSDLSIINSAKASFGKHETEFKPKEHIRLINYLARGLSQADYEELIKSIANEGWFSGVRINTVHQAEHENNIAQMLERYRHTPTHFSPFCHATVSLRLKAPIAIHAQMMKHTIGFAHNTVSRRYVSDTPELFVPEFREAPKGNVKQGSGDVIDTIVFPELGKDDGATVTNGVLRHYYVECCEQAITLYERMVQAGVAPEQARFVLPQGVLTEWVSTGSLYAWARFYNLRTDPHAQKEIQDLAKLVGEIIEPLYPVSWQALVRS